MKVIREAGRLFGQLYALSIVEDVAVVAGKTSASSILRALAEGVFWLAFSSEGVVGLGASDAIIVDVGNLAGWVLFLGGL